MTRGPHRGGGQIVDVVRPERSLLRLLFLRADRMVAALAAFAVQEIALWFLPVITAAIVDVVATDGPVRTVLVWFGVAITLLALNYPSHLLYTRCFMSVVRDTGVRLRNALTARLQSLSIGFHQRANMMIIANGTMTHVCTSAVVINDVDCPVTEPARLKPGDVPGVQRSTVVVSRSTDERRGRQDNRGKGDLYRSKAEQSHRTSHPTRRGPDRLGTREEGRSCPRSPRWWWSAPA